MSAPISVLWTVSPVLAPTPWRHCTRCGEARPFASSGRFRVNANGRRIDVWLVYRCIDCARVWNRPVVERRALDRLAPECRAAFEANDAALAECIARDLADLGRHAHRIERVDDVTIVRSVLDGDEAQPDRIDLHLVATAAIGARLDRILSEGLGLSRGRIRRLHAEGRVGFPSSGARSLGRPLRERLRVVLLLSGLPDRQAIAAAAAGLR